MLNHDLEDFSQRLILGDQHHITSTGIYKRAMLTGYLCIMVVGICLFYALYDAYHGFYHDYLLYFTLFNFAIIAFLLNKSGRFEFAKILLLTATLLVIFLFSATEPVGNSIYLNFFPLSVAAFALFDYKALYKGVIFTMISFSLFLLLYFYEIPLLPRQAIAAGTEASDFLIHFIISLSATVLIIIFLIKLNRTIEANLLSKDKNLQITAEELKASQQRFEMAISGSNSGIYDWDIVRNAIYHAPRWKKLLGYEEDELEDFDINVFYELVHPEDVERAKSMLQNHLINGTKYTIELKLRTKSGEYQWFNDSGQAVWNDQGAPIRMVGSIVKIHERKMAEERIKKQNRMLEKTNLELDNFVYSASHDIRSPLTSVLGLINIASKSGDKKEIDHCLELMKSRINRLDDFIEDILDFSRNLRLDKKYREINLYYFVDDIIKNHDFGDTFRKLRIKMSIPADFEVISDPLRLKIILKNLFSNSSRFSNARNETAWMSVTALRTERSFQLIVKDNGEGIRDELQDRIFEMFYRASENSKGSGLGLYIVNEMVNKLNGNIKVISTYGVGSQFIIELPDHRFAKKTDDLLIDKNPVA